MYYEVFEEIKHAYENHLSLRNTQLISKCLIDSFYELKSQVNPIYKDDEDLKRLVGKNYSYLLYQKIITGVSKGIFLGINPWTWPAHEMFHSNLRMRVPDSEITFDASHPILFFEHDVFSYENSCLKKWEDEVMEVSPYINARLNLSITREGFRANLNRILELMFSMRSSSSKRRMPWTIFLHELIVLQKTFTKDDIAAHNLTISSHSSGYSVSDQNFPELDFLEFQFQKSFAYFSSDRVLVSELTGDPFNRYTQFNSQIIGKIPLCHFYINEHMFIGKEEYTLDQYIEYFIYPWTKGKEIFIVYTGQAKEISLLDFKKELQDLKYTIVLGFYEMRSGEKVYFYAEPKMVKD